MGDLLTKFDSVSIAVDNRITPADRKFCEVNQAAYEAAILAYQELSCYWEDMENTQNEYKDEVIGKYRHDYLHSNNGPRISGDLIRKVIIPELHYNNASMSQFYMRFVRYNSTDYKDIYFLTYAGSLESNLMQMVLVKEKINLFMKGQDTDLDEIYEKFGVDFDLFSLMMRREQDEKGKFHIRWGEQKIA